MAAQQIPVAQVPGVDRTGPWPLGGRKAANIKTTNQMLS
jgi:hypothetical protein